MCVIFFTQIKTGRTLIAADQLFSLLARWTQVVRSGVESQSHVIVKMKATGQANASSKSTVHISIVMIQGCVIKMLLRTNYAAVNSNRVLLNILNI